MNEQNNIKNPRLCKIYRGLKVPISASEEFFDKILSYKSNRQEVFIATYPKCGTTWVQHIIFLLYNQGKPATHTSEIITAIPFPEQDGFPQTGNNYLAIKHHLPSTVVPQFEESKHIHVVRNPLDACVSYYFFLKRIPGYQLPKIDDFFEDFMKGDTPYGSFFDHLLSWYKFYGKPNILFLTYEYMKENHLDAVKKIANFLGLHEVAKDEAILNDVVRYSKSDFMRSLVDDSGFMKNYLKITASDFKQRNVFEQCNNTEDTDSNAPRMIRKGCVGDWANHLTLSQARTMKETFYRLTARTPAERLWQNIFQNL